MTTKERLLALLEANKGIYFSGQELGQKLNLSRAAVWKAIGLLRQEGYPIHAVTNRGYCLSEETDILSAPGVEKYLHSQESFTVEVVPSTVSTNALARQRAQEGAPEGYVLISNAQTGGRGRYGRTFYSPEGTGIYLSLLLRPRPVSAQQNLPLTAVAAVALCRAIQAAGGGAAQIKWVNDIFLNGKKVCGILTEGAYDMESGTLETAIVGVGINLYPPREGFPEELASIAGAIFDAPVNDGKNRLAAAFLEHFWNCYTGKAEYLEEYRQRSLVLGKQVTVFLGGTERQAQALDIDDACHLLVRYDDGQTQTLSSGEVSITLPKT
ncbi:MAG TPA: biotin--[acetyl-CoA-carboxylase] ligase [Candidatus Faecousia faecavium]|nr:biotin--[acetyl-CoA-carboxylase] ligase [Candidatus Faecousia faecavium]